MPTEEQIREADLAFVSGKEPQLFYTAEMTLNNDPFHWLADFHEYRNGYK